MVIKVDKENTIRINTTKYPIGKRTDIIQNIVKNKKVLDLGCVDHDVDQALKVKSESWLHELLRNNSKYCLGVDIDKKGVSKMRSMGYNVIVADVERMNLKQKPFDVIVAGEIIEHLDNPGLFFESVKKHLSKNGRFILTTPSPWSAMTLINVLLFNRVFINSTHVCYYDPTTLSYILERNGFRVEKVYWLSTITKPDTRNIFASLLIKFRPYMFSNFMIIAKKKSS